MLNQILRLKDNMATTITQRPSPSRFNRLVGKLNLPLIISLAFHGGFFALWLPELSLNSDNSVNLSDTQIVELGALEQSRLPDLNPQPQGFSDWNSIQPIQIPNFDIPDFPAPDFNSLPSPPIENDFFVNLPSPPPLPDYGSYTNIPEFNSGGMNLPAPPPLDINSLTPPPSLPTEMIPADNSDFDPFDEIVSSGGNVIDIIPKTPEEEAQIRQNIFEGRENVNIPDARDVFNNRNIPSQEIAVNPAPPTPVNDTLQERVTKLRQSLTEQTINTTSREATQNYVAWLKEVENPTPKEMTLTGNYPKDACIARIEGTATYGVTVNPEGEIINTALIKSAGYPLLNNRALQQIKTYPFTNSLNSNQPFHVYVNFAYNPDICPSLSISNVGKTIPNNSLPTETKIETTPPVETPLETITPPEAKIETTPPVETELEIITPPETELETTLPTNPPVSEDIPKPEVEIKQPQTLEETLPTMTPQPQTPVTEIIPPLSIEENPSPRELLQLD